MENAVIELKDLTKCYGSLKVVDHLNLSIRKGDLRLTRTERCRKTTSILMMLGLTEPTSGVAHVWATMQPTIRFL